MTQVTSNQVLVEQWRTGDQEAARRLFNRYVDRLAAVARHRIGHRLTARVDPEDVVQSVFRTFFGRVRDGQYSIDEPDDLCKLLTKITVHKTLRQVEYQQAARRNPGQETRQGDSAQERMMDILSRDPSPEATVNFIDEFQHFLNGLRREDRTILELRFQGLDNDDVARKLGVSDRKVRRVVERVRGLAEAAGLVAGEFRLAG